MKKKLHKDPPAFKIREILSLAAVADYLEISTSLLGMWEQGLRNLSTKAIKKLGDLEQDFEKIKSARKPGTSRQALQPVFDRSNEKRISKYSRDAEWQRVLAAKMKGELEDQEARHELDKAWLDIIDHKLAVLPETEESEGDISWLKTQLAPVKKRLKKNNETMAAKQLRVELLLAEAGVFEAAVRKWGRQQG